MFLRTLLFKIFEVLGDELEIKKKSVELRSNIFKLDFAANIWLK